MKRTVCGLLALAALVVINPGVAQTERVPDIKEIMAQANKPSGHYFQIARELKQDSPAWADLATHAKELARLGAALCKNAPPKGDRAGWDRLTKAYADQAKSLEQAVAAKDRKAALTAFAALGGNACTECHKAHRK
jgi:hypothetical protein